MQKSTMLKIGGGIAALIVGGRFVQYGMERVGRTRTGTSDGSTAIVDITILANTERTLQAKYPYVHKIACLFVGPVIPLERQ